MGTCWAVDIFYGQENEGNFERVLMNGSVCGIELCSVARKAGLEVKDWRYLHGEEKNIFLSLFVQLLLHINGKSIIVFVKAFMLSVLNICW
jgi:hypothetical protein